MPHRWPDAAAAAACPCPHLIVSQDDDEVGLLAIRKGLDGHTTGVRLGHSCGSNGSSSSTKNVTTMP
jgi:hypothetical protein